MWEQKESRMKSQISVLVSLIYIDTRNKIPVYVAYRLELAYFVTDQALNQKGWPKWFVIWAKLSLLEMYQKM